MNSKILVYNPNQLRKKQRTIYKKKALQVVILFLMSLQLKVVFQNIKVTLFLS